MELPPILQLFRIPEFYLDPTHRPLNQGSYNKL